MLKTHQTATKDGCPHDCGVCPEHEQNNSVPVIEITDVCNLDCPICFADNKHGYYMSDEEMERCLDILEASDSDVDLLVLTGGEPTAHPRLIELIEMAYRRPKIPESVWRPTAFSSPSAKNWCGAWPRSTPMYCFSSTRSIKRKPACCAATR